MSLKNLYTAMNYLIFLLIYTKKKTLLDTNYYTRTKREILKNDDLGIMNLIKEGKVSSINISLKKGTSIIKDEMKGKTLYIFTENHLLIAEYNK